MVAGGRRSGRRLRCAHGPDAVLFLEILDHRIHVVHVRAVRVL